VDHCFCLLAAPRPVLQGLGKVGRLDAGSAGQVGDGAGELEHPVVGAGRELELAHGRFHQALAGVVQAAPAPDLGRAHLAVGAQPAAGEALRLELPGRDHALADALRRLAAALAGQLVILDLRHLDVDIDPIEQRPRQTLLVAADRRRGAGAGPAWRVEKSTCAGIHRANQDKVGRKAERPGGPADHDRVVLERLAHDLEDLLVKLGHLIEEQHAAVGQRDLAGLRIAPAADQPGVGDGVVGRAKGPVADQWHIRRQQPLDRVDLGDLEGLVQRQRRQDRGHAACQQSLARAGRPAHQDVVGAGRGHLEGALDMLLALDIGQIDRVAGLAWLGQGPGVGRDVAVAVEVGGQLGQRAHRDHADAVEQRGLGGVGVRHVHRGDALAAGDRDHRQDGLGVAQGAIQRDLADKQGFADIGGDLPGGQQHPDSDRQVVGRTGLAQIGRGHVDRYTITIRELKSDLQLP
jgi:hypothetical protein